MNDSIGGEIIELGHGKVVEAPKDDDERRAFTECDGDWDAFEAWRVRQGGKANDVVSPGSEK